VRALGVEQVAVRLDDRFRLLSSGYRDAPVRQQTLRATIDWSWDLLSDSDRVLLRRLAVHESWALDAVDDVDGLARLVDRSLVTVVDDADGPRYRLLESVAAYGLERLREAGELEEIQEGHNRHYTVLAERADAALRGQDQGRWLDRLDQEFPNLRRSLDGAHARKDAALALRLVIATAWYLFLRGRLGEARRWVDLALAIDGEASDANAAAIAWASAWRASLRLLTGDGPDPTTAPPCFDDIDDLAQRARAEWFLGFAESDWGQMTTSEELVTSALTSCRDLGDDWGVAAALSTQAKQACSRGDLASVARAGEQSLALFRRLGDRWGQLQAMEWLGALAQLSGDCDRATVLHRDALRLAQDLGLWPQAADQLSWLGQIRTRVGDHEGALALHEQARRLAAEHSYKPGETFAEIGLGCAARQAGDLETAEKALTHVLAALRHSDHGAGVADAIVLTELGYIAELRGDAAAAHTLHTEGLTAARKLGDPRALARAFEGLAGAESLTGQHRQAARILGKAARARASAAVPLSPAERSDIERIAETIRAALGEAAFATEHDKHE
jgi:tetratricopeptide (TPR) repeat protein